MYILIDNYDSFTHNLYQYLRELTPREVMVVRNDAIDAGRIEKLDPAGIIISPGPGRPEDAGVSLEVVKYFAGKVPILGICLGHQVIAEAFGGRIVPAGRIVHGKAERIRLDGKGLFRSLGREAVFTRYHSLAVDRESVPECFEISARSEDGEIMGLRHREYVMEGLQFHPESIASEHGKKLLSNFLRYRREPFVPAAAIGGLLKGRPMDREEASNFMDELTEGNLTPAQTAGFLVGINSAGITAEEIAGCAGVLQKKRLPVGADFPLLDTCGTGGDGMGTFNISSLAALTAAACGAKVAKHGNRAVSSNCGSADFYRALGINIELTPQQASVLLKKTGFAFLFAPRFHSAMRHAAAARRDLGIKTIMNLLGPLVNPAAAAYQLIGVFSPDFLRTVAEAALLMGLQRVVTVHGGDGLDEISVSAPTKIVRAEAGGDLQELEIRPGDFGAGSFEPEELKGGDAEENAAAAREILAGGGRPALKEAVCVNAGAALWVYGRAAGIGEGRRAALEAVESGAVSDKLAEIVKESNRV